MADEKQGNGEVLEKYNESGENCCISDKNGSKSNESVQTDLCDWLYRRTKRSHKWKRTHFQLDFVKKKIVYGNDDKVS